MTLFKHPGECGTYGL